MHILGLILGLISAAFVWYWRFQRAKDAFDAASDAAGRVRGAYNRRKFKKQAEGSVLSNVNDPAAAAAILLVLIAKENGPYSTRKDDFIRSLLTETAGMDEKLLSEAMEFAEWASDQVTDGNDVIRKFSPLWREALTHQQQVDLVAMARGVAEQEGEPHPVADALVRRVRGALLS